MSFIGRNNSKITNRPSGGGNKKQGLAPKATQFFRPISSGSFFSTNAGGQNRFNFYCINQLGNIGGGVANSMYSSSADGNNCEIQYELAKKQGFNIPNIYNNMEPSDDDNKVVETIFNKYTDGAIIIRGTDGQTPVNIDSVLNYINNDIPQTDALAFAGAINPWNAFMSSVGPAYSGTIISFKGIYPIIWYDAEYVDGFYQLGPSSDPEPVIGKRNQTAFIIGSANFLGTSLFDGNSNADIGGNTSLPPISNTLGNRGTDILAYGSALPFSAPAAGGSPVGSSKYSRPDTNNTNKAFNPTFVASNSGTNISGNNYMTTKGDLEKIFNNLTKIKGTILKKMLGDAIPSSVQDQKKLAKLLNSNWGSGFEMEGYFFPPNYDPNESAWIKSSAPLPDNNRFNIEDMFSLNIASDAKTYNDWKSLFANNSASIDKIKKVYEKIYNDSIVKYGGWMNRQLQKYELPLTLITGVMLPTLNLQSGSLQLGRELIEYTGSPPNVANGKNYGTLQKDNIKKIGTATIDNTGITIDLTLP
jgi:hypothetical protein